MNAQTLPWQPLDIVAAITTQPQPLDFVLPGLVAGSVGGIVAPGATGKSWLALQLLAHIATGKDLLGLGSVPHGHAVLLGKEDPDPVLNARIHHLAQHLNHAEREELRERATILPCLGKPGDLLDGGQTATHLKHALQGARLAILDTLSRWHTGDENDRRDAAKIMRLLEGIAAETGATIIFLHHTNKAATLEGNGDKQQASRGSSVFVDEARWVAFLQTCTPDEAKKLGVDDDERRHFVRFGVSKANYCPPQSDIWLRREAGGVLVRFTPPQQAAGKARAYAAASGGEHDDDDF